jgi:hypothetical protein
VYRPGAGVHTLPASDEYILSMDETEEGPKRRKRNQKGTKERRKRDQRETKERRKRDQREKRETKDGSKWMLCAGIDKRTWNPIQHA